MIFQRNLFGIISNIFFLLFITSCSSKENFIPEVIGNKIIKDNINTILDSLSIYDEDKMIIELDKKVRKGGIPDNNDIFGITKQIKKRVPYLDSKMFYEFYISGDQFVLSDGRRVYIREVDNIKLSYPILKASISNFYFNPDENVAFLIVNKGIKGSIGQKLDIYYFKKIKKSWVYQNKDVLIKG